MNETIQKIITERANSFEYGKSNHRIKISELNREEEYEKDKYL